VLSARPATAQHAVQQDYSSPLSCGLALHCQHPCACWASDGSLSRVTWARCQGADFGAWDAREARAQVVDPLLEKGKAKWNKAQAKLKKRQTEWAGRAQG